MLVCLGREKSQRPKIMMEVLGEEEGQTMSILIKRGIMTYDYLPHHPNHTEEE